MFDANGNLVDPKFHHDWNYYLGHYNFSISMAEELVSNILSQANPENLPVIILQSDHGARNLGASNTKLEDYPDDYKTEILYTLLIPGYDYSKISQDVKPINTFPIVFNYLFSTNIPLK